MTRPPLRARILVTLLLGAVGALVTVGPATAAEGSIDHVEAKDGTLSVLYSLPGVGDGAPDLSTVEVSVEGTPVDATATLASDAGDESVRRTAVLAIDVSESMAAKGKFAAAKAAAKVFLDSAPDDLYVGIVTFAGTVAVAQEPTLDRAASTAVVDGLEMSLGTRLYDGLSQAVQTSGASGQRSIIVLSDGRDTSKTPIEKVTAQTKKSGVKVDVVALDQSPRDSGLLSPLSEAGGGAVISAADPKALAGVFAGEAQTLANQVLVAAELPEGAPREGNITVSLEAGDETYTRTAFVTLAAASTVEKTGPSTDLQPATPGFMPSRDLMLGGLVAVGLGVLVVLLVLLGGLRSKQPTLEERISVYTGNGRGQRSPQQAPQGVAASAVGMASKALESNRGFEAKLGSKLDAAGLALRPAEWVLLWGGLAIGGFALLFLFGGGNLLVGVIGLGLGIALPWLYLGHKQSRRLKAFNAQLAGTLQLMAGSLQAGLSLPQGMDTIVREGAEPMAVEFRRALVESRLGVPIEDALETIGERMMSEDFKWTVMAIRIQREVGGNLSELMLNVAGTLREREYLRRQVKSLSAEGRFSAYILLAMPPAILAYEFTTNRTYVDPLFTTPVGYVMLGIMGLLMGLGWFMMSRMIKLEV